jgi:hypothetical protein
MKIIFQDIDGVLNCEKTSNPRKRVKPGGTRYQISSDHRQIFGNRTLQLCRAPISQLLYRAFLQEFSCLNAGERLVFAHDTNSILSHVRLH